MRTFFLFASMLILFPGAGARAQDRAAPQRPGGQKWAVLVGVDDYTELRKLHYAGNDQRALAEQLVASGFPNDNVFVLDDKADDKKYLPFRSNIEKQIQLLVEMADKDDLVIVGFSGHGVQLEGKSYFCPEDAQIGKLSETIIPLDSIYDRLGKCKASLKLLLVDACRSDVVPEGRKGISLSRALGDFGGVKERPPEGILLLASCAPGQFSMEDPKFEHGVFMHFIIEGLQGKAATSDTVSLAGLYDYASLNTKRYVARWFNESQTPALKGEINGPFEICSASRTSAAMLPSQPPLVPSPSPAPSAGGTITNSIGMKMVLIPAGEFLMGSPESEKDRYEDEGPQHRVRITKSFYFGQYPVTLGQFLTFYHDANYKLEMERDRKGDYGYDDGKESEKRPWAPGFENGMDHPVLWVSWNDAVAFCEWLSKKEGKEYRLPTEAQWEYACRAGSTTRYYFGDSESELSDYAWYHANAGSKTHPVGEKKPNAWGLYDMQGNVWQWCADWYGGEYYAASPVDDPQGPDSGSLRVRRGGSWRFTAGFCRSAIRYSSSPGYRGDFLGLRVSLVPADK